MARWEVTYEGPMRLNIDATVRRLRLSRDGQDVGAVEVLLDGPDVEAIARHLPDRGEGRKRVQRAVAWVGARSVQPADVADDGTVRRVPVDPKKVRALVESDEEVPAPEDGTVLHSWDG